MGIHQKQGEFWAEPVELARRIPAEHPLRRMDRVLRLDFVRFEVAGKHGTRGNVPVDPAIIMRLMLLLFLDDVRSERELMRVLPLRIDYLWFLGYGLDDEVPDHSVLSKARARWGTAVFESLFSRVVAQCFEAGLISGDKVHVDSSLVRADASHNSVVKRIVEVQMGKLEGEPAQDAPAAPTPEPATDARTTAREKQAPANDTHQSKTDPDSTLVRHKGGKPAPSYKVHRVVDDKAGVITAVKTTHGTINEGNELMAMIAQHEKHTGGRVQTAVGDSCYGDTASFVALAQAGINAHVADLRSRQRNPHSEGIYPAEAFRYDSRHDVFHCPGGEQLKRHHFHQRRNHWEYRPARGVCAACPLREQCTRDKSGRTLKRHEHQELLDRARAQSHREAARADRKRRQWLGEMSFARGAKLHGMKRARWRRVWRQSIQDWLIAAVQNLKMLASHRWQPA